MEFRATDILEAEWTLVTVVADALVERGTLTRKQFKTLVTQTAQKAVTEAPQGPGDPAVTAGMVTMIFRS